MGEFLLFTKEFFEALFDDAVKKNAEANEMLGQRVFTGHPRIDVTLHDGTTYTLTYAGGDWYGDEVLTAMAYKEGEDYPKIVFLPYKAIARVEAFEPPKGKQLGFQVRK